MDLGDARGITSIRAQQCAGTCQATRPSQAQYHRYQVDIPQQARQKWSSGEE